MMNKKSEIIDDDLDFDDLKVEDLLKPRAEFRVSSGFSKRVMEEAKTTPPSRRRRWIPLAATSAAAAVAVLVILTVVRFHDRDTSKDNPATTASVEIPTQPPTDTLYKEIPSMLIAGATHPDQGNPPIRSSSRKRRKSKEAVSTESLHRDKPKEHIPQPVTEGEMPMLTRERSLDPDEVRVRMLENRRNAEIAYIDMMRAEIEANDAYISQLMTSENILNSNNQGETPF